MMTSYPLNRDDEWLKLSFDGELELAPIILASFFNKINDETESKRRNVENNLVFRSTVEKHLQ